MKYLESLANHWGYSISQFIGGSNVFPPLDVSQFQTLDLRTGGKCKRVLWNYIFRQVLLIGLLYMFICSLDFLSSAFRLLGGNKRESMLQKFECG